MQTCDKLKITKELFDSLYSENITKKEYDRIINLIDNRFADIVLLLRPSLKNKGWFDYGNCSYDSSCDSEGFRGYFDLINYKENIDIGGEYCGLEPKIHDGDGYYNNSFPTRWLWTDDRDILNEVNTFKEVENEKIKKEKEKAQKRNEQLKTKKSSLKM